MSVLPDSLAGWIVVAVLLFWFVGAYNRLVRLRASVLQAYAALDAALSAPARLRADQPERAVGRWGIDRSRGGRLFAAGRDHADGHPARRDPAAPARGRQHVGARDRAAGAADRLAAPASRMR